MTTGQGWGEDTNSDMLVPPRDYVGPDAAQCLARIFNGIRAHLGAWKLGEALDMLAAAEADMKRRQKVEWRP